MNDNVLHEGKTMNRLKLGMLMLGLASNLYASEYSFEFFSGTVYNMKEDIIIRQNGENDININNADLNKKRSFKPKD